RALGAQRDDARDARERALGRLRLLAAAVVVEAGLRVVDLRRDVGRARRQAAHAAGARRDLERGGPVVVRVLGPDDRLRRERDGIARHPLVAAAGRREDAEALVRGL